jgi:hypothetical protein
MKKTRNFFYILLGVSLVAGLGLFAAYELLNHFYHPSVSRAYFDKSGPSTLQIDHFGEVTFTDDEQNIKSITPGGYFKLRHTSLSGYRAVHIDAPLAGALRRSYAVDNRQRPYETEGSAWLRRMMPRVIRAGVGAGPRIDRILRTAGIAGVLRAIDRLEDDQARSLYFGYLLEKRALNDKDLVATLNHLARSLADDHQKATLLGSVRATYVRNEGIGRAYAAAAASIASDYQKAQLIGVIARHVPLNASRTGQLLTVAGTIASDFEKSQALRALIAAPVAEGAHFGRFVRMASTVRSDFEKSRLATDLIKAAQVLNETQYAAVLHLIGGIASDFEKGKALTSLLDRHMLAEKHYGLVLATIGTISSDYEKAKQLTGIGDWVADQHDASLAGAYAKVAKTIGSDFEYRQVMKKIE